MTGQSKSLLTKMPKRKNIPGLDTFDTDVCQTLQKKRGGNVAPCDESLFVGQVCAAVCCTKIREIENG